MELSTRYDGKEIEGKWYAHWEAKDYFSSKPDERPPFSILMPPPNVTGVLHMGHMLNITIQDILIRRARLKGFNACWVPGTDHASIATEAKVVKLLREQGIKKSDIGRDAFLDHAFQWKDKYGGIILDQLKKLGASCDWNRTSFTMDEDRSKHVIQAFIDLYNNGKLYRDYRMVNWDPEAKTVLSNEEVIYKEENARLFHVRYQIEGTQEYVTIATTRPETILGDSAIAVHPDDERYHHLKGKKAIVPMVNRSIPIIFDDYVEVEFGTGALKVTPAHDPNDYEIGKRHGLETIDVLNDDGTMSEVGQFYIGDDRFVARKKIVKQLDADGHLVDTKDLRHNVGRSERTNAVIEPKLSLQWYVNMESIASPALKAVMEDAIQFFPEKYKNTYRHWMENIRDWCISRQLWWGHRIPAYYYEDQIFVADSAEKALAQAKEKLDKPDLQISDLKQEEDVLDTWFSSWLWPISVFNGFENKEELDYYYPTTVLVTGWDIIFLWVARMIMCGYEWKNEMPFKHVYFTGMVRDKQRRKMSKSLGNSPDALKLIEDFGADGVRFGMLSCSPAGGDLLFDDKLVEQGRNFCNKIWNALRLIKSWEIDPNKTQSKANTEAVLWFNALKSKVNQKTDSLFEDYRLSEALINLYSFVWGDFCSWYLEMVKPAYGEAIDEQSYQDTINIFSEICTMLHPFMPFITEDVWHHLKERGEGEDCIASRYAEAESFDESRLLIFEQVKDIISQARDTRNKQGMKMKETLEILAKESDELKAIMSNEGTKSLLMNMGNLSSFEFTEVEPENALSLISKRSTIYVVLEQTIDVEAELEKLKTELAYQEGFLTSVNKKLSNERFVNNAPDAVVGMERKKQADAEARIKQISKDIEHLSK